MSIVSNKPRLPIIYNASENIRDLLGELAKPVAAFLGRLLLCWCYSSHCPNLSVKVLTQRIPVN